MDRICFFLGKDFESMYLVLQTQKPDCCLTLQKLDKILVATIKLDLRKDVRMWSGLNGHRKSSLVGAFEKTNILIFILSTYYPEFYKVHYLISCRPSYLHKHKDNSAFKTCQQVQGSLCVITVHFIGCSISLWLLQLRTFQIEIYYILSIFICMCFVC